MQSNPATIFAGLIAVLAITIVVFALALNRKIRRVEKMVRRLYGNAPAGSDIADNMARRITEAELKIERIDPRLDAVENIARRSVHRIGFKRFNPFSDTGGDNSFALALLNQQKDGVVLSSLYTREGVRIYGKRVRDGRAPQALSKEEKEVLEEAIKET
ncbi:MAG: DUF948 domain-containing protein [Patescibacteria group bacterium]